jgi:formate hydrogenlyase subunit 4
MLSVLLIFICSIFFVGIINKTKSICSGRKGPVVLQPIKDILRLLNKGAVYSETTSFIFSIAPIIYFASLLVALLFIPFVDTKGIISFNGDFVLFAYLLSFGKFFSMISSLDTGSSFEGMGASREALFSVLAEPAFFILMGSFALFTGHTSFSEIYASIHNSAFSAYSIIIPACFVLLVFAMIENSRMPFDDPKTHLELTMIHEVMILDNSGFDLGIIFYGSCLKFAIYGALIANLFLIPENPFVVSILLFIAIQFVLAVIIGITESFMARFRMIHNAQYILALAAASFLIFIGVMLSIGKFI